MKTLHLFSHFGSSKLPYNGSVICADFRSRNHQYLSHKKFISFKQGCSYRKVIDHYLSIQQLPAANILEMGSLDGIVSCVSLDVGIAILPLKYVQQSYFYPHIQIHALEAPLARMPTYLIAEDQNQWSSNMHLFFKHLHTEQSPSLAALET